MKKLIYILILVMAMPVISLPVLSFAAEEEGAEKEEAPAKKTEGLKPETPQPAAVKPQASRVNTAKPGEIMPFGYNLFSSQFFSGNKEPLNPNYQIVPGDQIDLQAWGAMDYAATLTVDSQGNIFLPDIGPVHVQGVTQSDLNTYVKLQVSKVYKENVELYTNLRGSLPVSVYVTGSVDMPGRYVGTSADSAIDYIFKAGGIDPERGSYRSIKIIRDNNVAQEIDLYDFLYKGNMPKIQIKEGDTILVSERGKVVVAQGQAKNHFAYEFLNSDINGADFAKYASPLPETTHALVTGTREGKPYKSYLALDKFAETTLQDGDRVEFIAGNHEDKIEIKVSGRHQGPKTLVVPLDAKLVEVLNNVPIDKNVSNTNAVFIRRESVVDKQKEAIDDSLQRLQETLLLARATGATTSQAASVSSAEVTMLDSFIAKVKAVKPEGRVVVVHDGNIKNISLEDGDEIVIPQKTDLVMVNGEVIMPQAIVWEDGDSVIDYIEKAGGFTDRANETNIIVVKSNGATEIGKSTDIAPGDEIMILPEIKLNSLEVTGKVVDILYKVAVAAVLPFNIGD